MLVIYSNLFNICSIATIFSHTKKYLFQFKILPFQLQWVPQPLVDHWDIFWSSPSSLLEEHSKSFSFTCVTFYKRIHWGLDPLISVLEVVFSLI